jgi:hypothetical protein
VNAKNSDQIKKRFFFMIDCWFVVKNLFAFYLFVVESADLQIIPAQHTKALGHPFCVNNTLSIDGMKTRTVTFQMMFMTSFFKMKAGSRR